LQYPKNITRDISNVGHWGNGSYEIRMNDTEDFEEKYELKTS
jgi:predicted transport protein